MLQGHFSMAILHNGSDKKIYGADDQLLLPKRNYSWSTGCRKKWTKNFLESVEQIYWAVEENFSDTKTILHLRFLRCDLLKSWNSKRKYDV